MVALTAGAEATRFYNPQITPTAQRRKIFLRKICSGFGQGRTCQTIKDYRDRKRMLAEASTPNRKYAPAYSIAAMVGEIIKRV